MLVNAESLKTGPSGPQWVKVAASGAGQYVLYRNIQQSAGGRSSGLL